MNAYNMIDLKTELLKSPSSQLDPSILPLIREWNDLPTALQLLHVLDVCVHIGGASQFLMMFFNELFEDSMKRENTTVAALVPFATWRK